MNALGRPLRSAQELASAKAELDELVASGVLSAAEAAPEYAALREEALARVRAREPAPVAAPRLDKALPAASPAPPPPPAPPAPAAALPAPVQKRARDSDAAVDAAVARLEQPAKKAKATIAPPGSRSVLSFAGFTRQVLHRGEAVEVAAPPALNFGTFRCCNAPACLFSCDSRGPMTMHERSCKHGAAGAPAATAKPSKRKRVHSDASDDADDEDSGAEGAAAHPGAAAAQQPAQQKVDGRRNNRGSRKRRRYAASFKASALDQLAAAMERGEAAQSVEEALGIAAGMLSKWKAEANSIYSTAAEELSKGISPKALRKMKANARYPAMEAELVSEIRRYRARGRHLSIRWLTVKARAIFQKLFPGDAAFKASRGWRCKFMRRNQLTRKKATNTKSKSVAERLPDAQAFHQKLAQLVSCPPPGKPDAPMDDVFGRWLLTRRFNLDQVALPFTSAADKTIEFVGVDRPRERVQSEGLLKRQATINLCFPAVLHDRSKPGRIGLIFRGQGKLPAAELAAYDSRVRVSFQPKAWMDRPTAQAWLKDVWAEQTAELSGDKLLLCDNLDAHVHMGFRRDAKALGTLVWYLPPNCTDFLQPVDAGAGALIVLLYLRFQDAWLDKDANLEQWEGKLSASQRRILMTQWLGAAWEAFNSPDYDHARLRYFEKTGCAMSADGSRDFKITPEGTVNYSFTRLSPADAASAAAGLEEEQVVPEAAPEPDSDDEAVQHAAEESESELADEPPLDFETAADDPEETIVLFDEMVAQLLKPDEQLRLQPAPQQLDKALVGRFVAVRVTDVGWCAGQIVGQSSRASVKSYNYKVRFDAGDVSDVWLRDERYVGSSTLTAANWSELDACPAGSWTLFALSVAPRGVPASIARAGARGGFVVTPQAVAAAAARTVPPANLVGVAPAAPTGPSRVGSMPAPLAALVGQAPVPPPFRVPPPPPQLLRPTASAAPFYRQCWTCRRWFPPAEAHAEDPSSCYTCT